MNQLDLHGRAAIVTGCARGIGRAIARRIVASGARVAPWDVDGAGAARAAAALGAAHRAVDLTDEAAVRAAAAEAGTVDILVNNAGITGGNAPTWELPSADISGGRATC